MPNAGVGAYKKAVGECVGAPDVQLSRLGEATLEM